jgi:hypothetical protein
MCALRASQRAKDKSAYLESVPIIPASPILDLVGRRHLVGVHARHPRAARPLGQPGAERVDGGRRPAGFELDASVGQVPHPPLDAETPRLVRRRGAETDTLHAASHDGTHPLQG